MLFFGLQRHQIHVENIAECEGTRPIHLEKKLAVINPLPSTI
jgi:hypothetical protein